MVAMRMSTVGTTSRMLVTQPLATKMTGSFRGHCVTGMVNMSINMERKSTKICASRVSWLCFPMGTCVFLT